MENKEQRSTEKCVEMIRKALENSIFHFSRLSDFNQILLMEKGKKENCEENGLILWH